MARKLTDLMIDRVDLCKLGANFDIPTGDGAHILLMKHAPTPTLTVILSETGEKREVPIAKLELECPSCEQHLQLQYGEYGSELPNFCPNCGAQLQLKAKGGDASYAAKAAWTQAYVDALPDSAFAVIEPGGVKDATGKTTRSLRHLPYRDSSGSVDKAHLSFALASLAKSTLAPALKAHAKSTLTAADSKGIQENADMTQDEIQKSIDEAVAKAVAAATAPLAAENATLKKAVEDQKAIADAAAALAKSERDTRLTTETRNALAVYKHLPIKLEGDANDVTLFKTLIEKTPEAVARIHELFKAADALIAGSKVSPFKVVGKTGEGDSADDSAEGAYGEIQKAAQILLTDGKVKSLAEGITAVTKANPELVAKYEAEFVARRKAAK